MNKEKVTHNSSNGNLVNAIASIVLVVIVTAGYFGALSGAPVIA